MTLKKINIVCLLKLWEFYIMYANSAHLSVPPYSSVAKIKNPQTKQTKRGKTKTKAKQPHNLFTSSFLKLQHLFIHPGGTGSCDVLDSIPFCPISFAYTCSLQ